MDEQNYFLLYGFYYFMQFPVYYFKLEHIFVHGLIPLRNLLVKLRLVKKGWMLFPGSYIMVSEEIGAQVLLPSHLCRMGRGSWDMAKGIIDTG